MSKEHAYAYEAGYRDGSINYELEHCSSCKNVADLQEALAENAKLRELVKDFLDVPCQCLKCEHYNYEEDRCDLHDRACELGVEV